MTAIVIDPTLVLYLKGQIEGGDALAAKRALQQLCEHYRRGKRLAPPQLGPVENAVVGALWTMSSSPKVRRWALNAIAQFGRKANCEPAVLHAINAHQDDPETVASAVFTVSRRAI